MAFTAAASPHQHHHLSVPSSFSKTPSILQSASPSLSFLSQNHHHHRYRYPAFVQTRAAAAASSSSIDDGGNGNSSTTPLPLLTQQQQQPNKQVEESVNLLKQAAKTRKVPAAHVLSALSVLEKAKLDPSPFFHTLGGSQSPGNTWMLVFTSQKQLKGGRYFPLTAVQRFDAAGKRIENGVYLGPFGSLTFEGRLSWNKKILAFDFETVRIKLGPFKPLQISLGQKDVSREPSTKDPFFIWFYVDEELAVARGRAGGTAFWCRCRHVVSDD